ncbi:MAG: BBP7 family outer membrane beta-barrel protein [Planctomycetota bacterium]
MHDSVLSSHSTTNAPTAGQRRSRVAGFGEIGGQRILRFALTLLLLASTAQVAQAQLRTGRGEREFYQAPPMQTLAEPETLPKNGNAAPVVSAGYVTQMEPVPETIQAGPYEFVPSDTAPTMEMHAPSEYYGGDGGCDSCGVGDCGIGGCGQVGCSGSCGGSMLTPAASAYCPPGCGPLMALWYRTKVRAEVPMYWRRDQGPPALVTSATSGTAADVAGELGQATTDILFGNGTLTNDATAGIRLTFSTYLGPAKCYGVTLRYWNAGDQNMSSTFDSGTFPILARPFFNTTVTGSEEQDTQLVAFPNESVGNIRIDTTSEVGGIDFYLRRELYKDRFNRLEWLWGYQNASIDESLTIFSNTTVTGNNPGLTGTSIAVSDQFETENDFNGMSYGLMNTRTVACWRLETMFRLGAGNLRRKVNIRGTTTTASGGVTSTDNQGLLARATNAQAFVDDTFIVIPELAVNLGYRIRPGLDFNLGYNYMVIPKVAQAAQQIDNDLAVNLSDPLSGALDPQLDFSERQYWLHSLGFGLQLRY